MEVDIESPLQIEDHYDIISRVLRWFSFRVIRTTDYDR